MVVGVPSGFASSMRMKSKKFPLLGNASNTDGATFSRVNIKAGVVMS